MSKKRMKIKFDLADPEEQKSIDDESNSTRPSNRRLILIPFRKIFASKKYSSKSNLKIANKKNYETDKQKIKLAKYLSVEKPIVQTKIQIDDDERVLLDTLANGSVCSIDLDKYFKFPELKAKDKLWKIPYRFSSKEDHYNCDDEQEAKSINRFGEGVNDGCMIGLNLPKIYSKRERQKFKTWDELLKTSDQVLEQFSNTKWSRLNRNRRGSILQPRHVFLTPNPEVGCGEKFLLANNKNQTLREWSSELFIGMLDNEDLLDSDYRLNILKNVSINDLSSMIYPELKLSFNEGMMSDSDMLYIQAVSKRRRQSLVPPNFSGEFTGMMSFRRQSFAGGQLWSTEAENNRQREVYLEKVALINPDHKSYILKRLDSISTTVSEFTELQINSESLIDNYPYFDPRSHQQARLFANELLLIVRKYFNSIKSFEIINFMTFANQSTINASAHIKGLLHFQNRIIRLIATYILRNDKLEQRVDSILFFIHVIRELHQMDNWHSVNLVTQSLQCPSVVRLKETWRKITFNHPEDYCYFIQISEDLTSGTQWKTYEISSRFIPIFDDVIEMIKERCGLMIVQINQHRLHSSWSHLKDDDTVGWIDNQVGSLIKDCQAGRSLVPSSNTKQQRKKPKLKTNLLHRIFYYRRTPLCSRKNDDLFENASSPNMDNSEAEQDDDDNESIYQRRLLKGSKNEMMIRRTSKNRDRKTSLGGAIGCAAGSLPSCKKFWSITEFYKLRANDRELVKQQIVRTLVSLQKKTFYVFEERDEEIRNFLLNTKCDSMNDCMLRSRSIEKQEHSRQVAANRREFESDDKNEDDDNDDQQQGEYQNNESNQSMINRNISMIMVNGHANHKETNDKDQQQVVEPKVEDKNNEPNKLRTIKRRVMFA